MLKIENDLELLCIPNIISCSSVGRASVLWAEGLGFDPQRENNLVSFMVKHLPLRAEEVGSILTSDRGARKIPISLHG